MGLTDLFRPKHKHSDARVRAEAVRGFGRDDRALLEEIARGDRDSSVRRVAVERIEDAELLTDLVSSEKDDGVRRIARERATELLVSQALSDDDNRVRSAILGLVALGDERALANVALKASRKSVRRSLLDRIEDSRALAEIVRRTENHNLRISALARINDSEVLRAIAIDERKKDVAIAAVDRIDDVSALEAVVVRGKSKAARSRASRRIAKLKPSVSRSDEEKRAHATQAQLCRSMEVFLKERDWASSHDKAQAVADEWDAQSGPIDGDLEARFEKARRRYFEEYARFDELVRERDAKAARKAAPVAAAIETPAEESVATPEQERVATRIPEESERARTLPNLSPPPPGREDEPLPADVAAEASADDAADEERGEGRAPVTDEERRENLGALEAISVDLEEVAGLDKLKLAEKRLKQAERRRKELGPLASEGKRELLARYDEARRAAKIHIGELREAEDWKRWANVPKQEELIKQAGELLASAAEESKLGDKLKSLQAAWKKLGASPREKGQENWEKFKEICDQVYEHVKEHRSRRSEEQKKNLELKEALCVRAEELAESTDWGPTAEAFKKLQGEWKEIGPVPRRQSDSIWKRFRGACDTFFERRRPHMEKSIAEREKSLESKRAVVAKVEALIGEDTDWDAAIESLKDIRSEWRDTGRVGRRDYAELEQAFRSACDRVYEGRDKARAELLAAKREKVEGLRSELEAAAGNGTEATSLVAQTLALRTALLDLAAEGAVEKELRSSVDATTRSLIEAHAEAFGGTDLDPVVVRKRKEKLLARIEEIAPVPEVAPAVDDGWDDQPDSPEAMAEKLRNALAERALGGVSSTTGGRPVVEIVDEAVESWERLGPIPGSEGLKLEERFEQACERARTSDAQ